VAEARKDAGLTLAEVAGSKLSRTAIHLVEKGVTRPSMDTLTHIARQTHKPLSFFLHSAEVPSGFADRGQLQKAARRLATVLAAREETREPSAQAKVHMVLGQIEEWCGNVERADQHFESAIRILSKFGQPDLVRDAHMNYAELLETRQAITRAAHHWKVAADIGKLMALGLDWIPAGSESAKQRAADRRG
jgi:transcriptional regulator with XRE-family HTH domain